MELKSQKGSIAMVLKRFCSNGTKMFKKSSTVIVLEGSTMMELERYHNDRTKKCRKVPQ